MDSLGVLTKICIVYTDVVSIEAAKVLMDVLPSVVRVKGVDGVAIQIVYQSVESPTHARHGGECHTKRSFTAFRSFAFIGAI